MTVNASDTEAENARHNEKARKHKAARDKIRAVLNDEQKTKYDAMQAQMQERRQSREGGTTPPPPPPAAPSRSPARLAS